MEKSKIQWNGEPDPNSEGAADNNEVPSNIDIVWSGYVPCWYPNNYADCVIEDMYYEDFNIQLGRDGEELNINDIVEWNLAHGRSDIASYLIAEDDLCIGASNLLCMENSVNAGETTYLAPKKTYTWGDVSFVLEIFDGIGSGSRRAREKRLNQFEEEKKKRLIRLICRVKGEKVYDEEKKLGDTYIKLEDADLVIEEVLGKIRVENANVV